MIAFIATLLRLFFQAFLSKRNVLSENALLKKENEILLRKVGNKRVRFSFYDKLFFVVLNKAADIKYRLTLVKPETLLSWQRTVIKRFWTFEHAPAKRGRKPVDTEVKNLILSMKNDNLLWGVKRIQGELLKLDISLSTKTIRKILQGFRRKGKIRKSLTWKKFLESQIQFIYAMDFLTVDTMLGKRFYVFAIISHKTREIVRLAIIENPTREFVRQQLMLLSETIARRVYLIHDNALMFNMDFLAYNLVSIKTGVEAPNMNSILERFFGSVRREALDNFLLIGRSQIEGILEEYIAFYNSQRPHQGIQQQTRILVNPRKQVVLFAGVQSWVGCINTTTDKRRDGWKKSTVRGNIRGPRQKNRLLQGLNHILTSPQHSIHDSLSIDLLPSCIVLYELRNILFQVNRKIQSSIWSIEFPPFSATKIILLFHFTTLNGIDGLLSSWLDAQKGCESKHLID